MPGGEEFTLLLGTWEVVPSRPADELVRRPPKLGVIQAVDTGADVLEFGFHDVGTMTSTAHPALEYDIPVVAVAHGDVFTDGGTLVVGPNPVAKIGSSAFMGQEIVPIHFLTVKLCDLGESSVVEHGIFGLFLELVKPLTLQSYSADQWVGSTNEVGVDNQFPLRQVGMSSPPA